MEKRDSPFYEQELRSEILGMILFDRQFLRRCGDRVKPADFESGQSGGYATALASIGLDYWRKNRVPVSNSLGRELTKWCRDAGLGADRRKELAKIVRRLRKRYEPDRSTVVQGEVREFQQRVIRAHGIRELASLESAGELTDDHWMEITRKVLADRDRDSVHDWLEGLAGRHVRRITAEHARVPMTLIEPLDNLVQPIGRGDLGLALAPYKRGKSLFLIWLAVVYAFQGLNVLFATLEDPLDMVEDRIDACVSGVRVNFLGENARKVRRRVKQWGTMLRTRIRIYDGTEGGTTVQTIEAAWERERADGFDADVVIVDYDDEIAPSKRMDSRRFEFAEIYRQLRQFASRAAVILWTAAQATREAESKDLIEGKDAAEDISKIRKATLSIGIGSCSKWNGEQGLGGDAKTLHVITHKFDRSRVWCRIWSDPSKGLFYDADKTLEWLSDSSSDDED